MFVGCDRSVPVFQALVYPLTVAKKSSVPARERAAQMILKNMREHSETLVQQEFMVSAALVGHDGSSPNWHT